MANKLIPCDVTPRCRYIAAVPWCDVTTATTSCMLSHWGAQTKQTTHTESDLLISTSSLRSPWWR